MSTRVLVVDDTAIFRRVITEALRGVPGVEVAGTANNGKLALSRIAALQPDLVTLDIEMPEMNGIEVLEAMRSGNVKAAAVMVSSLTSRGGQLTVRALELGAFDFITKPEQGEAEQNIALVRDRLVPIIRAFERSREIRSILGAGVRKPTTPPVPHPTHMPSVPAPRSPRRAGSPIVLIGVSTGGPAALAKLLPSLPSDLGAPVLIVQHMPPLFTGPLAESLSKKCTLPVREATDGEPALPGHAYVAPGGKQMKIAPGANGEILVRVTDDPPELNCKPAVDYLFRSAALHFPGRSIAAVLTGMGNDGTEGLRLLKRSGCVSVAQDEASCVVFGMPKEAIAAGVVDTVAPLDAIGGVIARAVREGRA
jgi:two-component system chemotaxis response regulator CheB